MSIETRSFFMSGWRRKLDVCRSMQHVDSVCGIQWGESWRSEINRRKARAHRSLKSLNAR
jgi:hypothetical protein